MLKIRKALDKWYDWCVDGLDRWYRWSLDGTLWLLAPGLLVVAVSTVVILVLMLLIESILIGAILAFLCADFVLMVWADCWGKVRRADREREDADE